MQHRRVVIVANGSPTGWPLPEEWRDAHVIAADGGARHAVAAGMVVHELVGDLDSIDEVTLTRIGDAKIHRYPPDKDETDLEIALRHALAYAPSEIGFMAVAGGRLDQLLGNVHLLSTVIGARVWLFDESTVGVFVRAGERVSLSGSPGDTFSLVPYTPVVEKVSLSGVRWPLDRAQLRFGSSLSISNALTETTVVLSIGSGCVLALMLRQGTPSA